MKESDIKARINRFIDRFDQAAAAVRSGVRKVVLPATLGVGLALAPGCASDDTDRPAPTADASKKGGSDSGVPDPQPEYAAPFPNEDAGNVALYAAPFPDDAGADTVPMPQPEYAAPFPDGGGPDGMAGPLYAAPFPDASTPDGQAVALYAAPFPDAGTDVPNAAPEYAAPFPDGGNAALYAAPFPDDASS